MKTACFSVGTVAIITGLVLACSNPFGSVPGQIDFTGDIEDDDLTANSIRADIDGEIVEFMLDYSSGRDRGFSFFDPPAGEAISIQGPLPERSTSATVTVAVSDS